LIIKSLKVNNLRNVKAASLQPCSTLNLILGDNGAGKTTLLEALMLLAKGRSFRGGQVGALIGPDSDHALLVADIEHNGTTHRLGLERHRVDWRARIDGNDVQQLSELSAYMPVALLEPTSHLLITGGPELRRRFTDWGVFHVEQSFLADWRLYNRALKQRNAALRDQNVEMAELLNPQLERYGMRVHGQRAAHLEKLTQGLAALLTSLSPEMGEVSLEYFAGWREDSFTEALAENLGRDLERGVTVSGPHRADLVIRGEGKLARDRFSRGEQKILAVALILAQAQLLTGVSGQPVLLLDDLASEFDHDHLGNVLQHAIGWGGQVFITGVSAQPFDEVLPADTRVFHVKHGVVEQR
jgi:DNA replication and repair protein RecF